MVGDEIYSFAELLWPINRSLTGKGVRQTLELVAEKLPELKIHSIRSGTQAFDWEIPLEWNVNSAFIESPDGNKICDFAESNLHLVGYSIPFEGVLGLEQLQHHLHSLPEQPDAIPYVTSYYEQTWGFCLPHSIRKNLQRGSYKVKVDTTLRMGVMNIGELYIKGDTTDEIFISTYICHPSMANNEISGPAVTTYLARWIQSQKQRKYSYRIVFVPETIGSIYYLSKNYLNLKEKVYAGFNVTCVGDDRTHSFLPSRGGQSPSDRASKHVLSWIDKNYTQYSWKDRGSDERQYCAPGIDLPVVSLMRTKYGEYPEYHTSLDKLGTVVTPSGLHGGFKALRRAVKLLENDAIFYNKILCEPQMGRRGLYPTLSVKKSNQKTANMMNILSFCDGCHSVLDISEELSLPYQVVLRILKMLERHELVVSKDIEVTRD